MSVLERKKTFLFITNTKYDGGKLTGGHKRFLELVKGVAKKNNVILVSRKIPELKEDGIKVFEVPEGRKTFLPSHINKILVISKILKREKKNIKYDYAISFGPADTICYKMSGYGNIVTLFREDYVGYRKIVGTSALKMIYHKFLEKYAVKNSKKIIVQCEDDKNALVDRYAGKVKNIKSKIYVQTNNVNASWILGGKTKKQKSSNDVVKIVFIGNFADDRKGHHLLLPAAQKLAEDGYNIELDVVGDGKQLERYKEKYKDCKNIIFFGRANNVGDLLAESDFEIVPSLMDSCPNTVLEGLNAGIAVYGSNVGGIKEILRNKEYLFEPNIDAVYEFIKKVIDEKRYIVDAEEQGGIKKRLTFDWSDKIERIIVDGELI